MKSSLGALAAVWLITTPTPLCAAPVFDFSFTDGSRTVTGEIDGLLDGTHSAAEHLLVQSVIGIPAPFTLPYDTIIDRKFPFDNEFVVAAGHITSASYHAENAAYTLDLESPGLDAILIDKERGEEIIGPIQYTLVAGTAVPEPTSLVLLLAAISSWVVVFSRNKARRRHER